MYIASCEAVKMPLIAVKLNLYKEKCNGDQKKMFKIIESGCHRLTARSQKNNKFYKNTPAHSVLSL